MLLWLVVFLCVSCDPDRHTPEIEQGRFQDLKTLSHDMIVLGDKLEDPYSISNVKKALSALYPTKAGSVQLSPTDIYVRFLPKNDAQYEALERAGIRLLDHPLDYQIVKEGDYYHDPAVDEESITWQYAVVPPSFEFIQGIEYEILDECYISENATTRADDIDWDLVEREAFRLTGNESMLRPETKGESMSPSGRITIIDEKFNGGTPVGVSGVTVSCNTFVKQETVFTDDEGYYQFSKKYTSDMRYRLIFKNERGFGIGFNLLLVPGSVSTLGTNPPSGVDVQIDSESDDKLYLRAVVNNAAAAYYDKCADPECYVAAPPDKLRLWIMQDLPSSSAPMLQQGAVVTGTVLENYLGIYASLIKTFLPDITIGARDFKDYATIYEITCHELAHASHFSKVGVPYWNSYIKYILESYITSLGITYGKGTEFGAGYCEVGEMWAYYNENLFATERYGHVLLNGTTYWFSPQIFLYLDERGLDRSRIFKALKPEVTSAKALKEELLKLYPDSEEIINQAFDRYYKEKGQ